METLLVGGYWLESEKGSCERVGPTSSFGTIQTTGNLTLAGVLSVYHDAANEGSTTGTTLSGVFSNIGSGQRLYSADGSSFIVTINGGVDEDAVLSDFVAPELWSFGAADGRGVRSGRLAEPKAGASASESTDLAHSMNPMQSPPAPCVRPAKAI
jgi:hypothetical protein